MFDNFEGYQEPTVEKINKNCTVATYLPEKSNNTIIVGINTYNKNTIYLKNDTLLHISNNMILKLLNTLPKVNKKVSKRKTRKKK